MTSGRHARPTKRQTRARDKAVVTVALIVSLVLGGVTEQLAEHGWRQFVTRPPGIGGSPDTGP
jgi:hypothetical protein